MPKKEKETKGFKFLPKAVVADVAFEATGKNLPEVFKNSALATMETMVDTKNVTTKLQKVIKIQNKDIGALLIDFLNEIVYYKDAEQMLLGRFDIDLKQKDDKVWVNYFIQKIY